MIHLYHDFLYGEEEEERKLSNLKARLADALEAHQVGLGIRTHEATLNSLQMDNQEVQNGGASVQGKLNQDAEEK